MAFKYNYQNYTIFFTKIVVRRLPPNFTIENFLQEVYPLPRHNYIYFVTPDKADDVNVFSRAYINFINSEDVFTFKGKFHNYAFLGPNGNTIKCLNLITVIMF